MAYVEAGPADGPVVLLLHGEPSWSFLYRKMIPVLADAGLRAVAPDLVGFGRSDKPTAPADHTYARHVEWMRALAFDALDLREVTLVGQDWGGLIGLRLVAEHPDRFAARGRRQHRPADRRPRHAARCGGSSGAAVETGRGARRRPARRGRLRAPGSTTTVRAAYDAPFPDEAFKAGPRAIPTLVPTAPDDPAAAGQPGRVGGAGRAATSRSWSRSATATRSPAAWRRCCSSGPRRRGPTTRDRRTPATSSRRTPASELGGVVADLVHSLDG